MIDGWLFALTLAGVLGCGLIAGVFFAFSSFVMKALARLPSHEGVAAMQAINIEAPTPGFMAGLFGTAAVCIALVVASLLEWGEPFAVYLLVGGLLYLVGTILLTIVYHIPRNAALAIVDPHSADGTSLWTRYVRNWTAWNHVRTVAPLAAAAMFTIALHVG